MKHIKLFESLNKKYYIQDDPRHRSELPPGVEHSKMMDIDQSDIDYIKRGLGIDTKVNIIGSWNQIKTLNFYYNTKTGEIGNLNTMSNVHEDDTCLVMIDSYEDEWFRVNFSDILLFSRILGKKYWCDQVEGVVQCIKDVINKDVYYNYIND